MATTATQETASEASEQPEGSIEQADQDNPQETSEAESGVNEEAEKAPAETFSRTQKVIARQQRELRLEREKIQQDKELFAKEQEEKRAIVEKWTKYEEQLKGKNPWTFIRESGYNLEDLYNLATQDQDKVAQEQANKALEDKFQSQIDALKQEQTDKEVKAARAQEAKQKAQLISVLDQTLAASPDEYELLLQQPNAGEYVAAIMLEHYMDENNKTGVVLQYAEAAKMAEEYLLNEQLVNNPYVKTKKFRTLMQKEAEAEAESQKQLIKEQAKANKKSTSSAQKVQKGPAEPRTLRQEMVSTRTATDGKESHEQKAMRLAKKYASMNR